MRLKSCVALIAAFLALGSARVFADPFIVTLPTSITAPSDVLEGTLNIPVTVSVTNNTGLPLILDLAVAIINPLGPDFSDIIQFSGPNGGNGLQGFPATLAIGATGNFVYSVDAPNPPLGTDFGVNNFSFWVEYSAIQGIANVPNINLNGPGILIVGGQVSGILDPAVLATLGNCIAAPATCVGPVNFLYPPSLNGGNPAFGGFASTFITVHDVPEPSTLALLTIGLLATAGSLAWRRNRGKLRANLAG